VVEMPAAPLAEGTFLVEAESMSPAAKGVELPAG
jgi:hypothetical protein